MSSDRGTQRSEIRFNVFPKVSWERRISGASMAISSEIGAAGATTYRPGDRRSSPDQDPEWYRLSETQLAHEFESVAVEQMLRAEMNHRCRKRRSSIARNGIGSGQNVGFVYPLPPLILQLQIISVEHFGTVHPCVCRHGKRAFEGQWFDDEPRRNVRDVGQIWLRPTDLGPWEKV
jgi:hypothetical protein